MLAAALLTLSACSLVSEADLSARFDLDGDGVSRPADCDDGDATLGAANVWYADGDGDGFGATASTPACAQPDGYVAVDGDCDDQQSGLNPAMWWYPDFDGDTYGAIDAGVQQCEPPTGYIADGHDCLDTDASVLPGGEDTWYDGVDGNCDGASDYDADGDGADSDAYAGSDCDDTTDTIGPNVPEVCSNRIDDDCDGVIANTCAFDGDVSLDLADLVWTPVDDVGDFSPYIGKALASGDLLGDGSTQVVLGAPRAKGSTGEAPSGAVFVVPSTVGGLLDDVAMSVVRGNEVRAEFGGAAAILDLSGDGHDDLVVGSGSANDANGQVMVFFGPLAASVDSSAADAHIAGVGQSLFGTTVESLGDINGDGFDDAVASNSSGGDYRDSFDAVLYGGRTSWTLTDGVECRAGVATGAGDVDGDGQNDILFAGYFSGGPMVFTHAPQGMESVEAADAGLWGVSGTQVRDALEIIPDTNRDGYDDILLGGYGYNAVAQNAGAAFIFLGPPTSSPDVLVLGETYGQQLGTSVTGADIDADGQTDFIIGDTSRLYVFLSPISGSVTVSDYHASITDARITARQARTPGDP